MTVYDCFNGDADGICALTQLRLQQAMDSVLVTGIKRDINLLKRVNPEEGDHIVALDISLDINHADVTRCLGAGASVFYCDHHYAGEEIQHPKFESLINTSANVCTSYLINSYLKGAFIDWAIVGTFGDNLTQTAGKLVKLLSLDAQQVSQLSQLGILLNYNGYGTSLDDLYFDPADMVRLTSAYTSAFEFLDAEAETYGTLCDGYESDMGSAFEQAPLHADGLIKVVELPDTSWARRVSGVFGNELANRSPDSAHAILTKKENGDYLVSVRAPLNNKQGADEVCRQFATGGGRAAAAGINNLPSDDVGALINKLTKFYQSA